VGGPGFSLRSNKLLEFGEVLLVIDTARLKSSGPCFEPPGTVEELHQRFVNPRREILDEWYDAIFESMDESIAGERSKHQMFRLVHVP